MQMSGRARRSRLWLRRGPSYQKRDLVRNEQSSDALVECDEAIAFGTVGLVPNDTIGKVAPAREHRDPGVGGRTFDFDLTDDNKAAEDVDDLRAGISIRPLQHPYQFAQDDRRHDNRIRPLDRGGRFDGLPLIVPCQIAGEDVGIDSNPHRPPPASIAFCISLSETRRRPDRRSAPRRLFMSSRTAAATNSIRPFSNKETLTLAPGTTPRWFSTARQGDLSLRRDRQFE